MSYNIDQWKTKKLENLRLPLSALFIHERRDWHPKVTLLPGTNNLVIEGGCGQELLGTVKDEILTITGFNMTGEGSGTFYAWVLEPALKQSKGKLEAVLIWESGDSISRLTVEDGNVNNEPVEL